MDIRFVSTLTPDDEDHLAPALLTALAMLLDQTPLAYTLRIQTSSEAVFDHSHPAARPEPADVGSLASGPSIERRAG